MGMTPQERRKLRRDQVERCLSSQMTIEEWCRLNHVAESTIYRWMARFRNEEPELFGKPAASQWIELSRESIAAQTALAMAPAPAAPVAPTPADDVAAERRTAPIVVHLNGADVAVPAGSAEADISTVLRAVAAL